LSQPVKFYHHHKYSNNLEVCHKRLDSLFREVITFAKLIQFQLLNRLQRPAAPRGDTPGS
jgi:hypothetical protein